MNKFIRTFFLSALLTAIVIFVPSFVHAQLPPPATSGSHPTALPPTEAPTKPLPAALLPNGLSEVSASSSVATDGSVATSTEPLGVASSVENGTIPLLVGAGVLILASIGWFLIRRQKNPPQTEIHT